MAFHLWSRAYRHTFQADIPVQHAAKAASQAHVKRLLHFDVTAMPAESSDDLKIHEHDGAQRKCLSSRALGHVRSLEEFFQHCNIYICLTDY